MKPPKIRESIKKPNVEMVEIQKQTNIKQRISENTVEKVEHMKT